MVLYCTAALEVVKDLILLIVVCGFYYVEKYHLLLIISEILGPWVLFNSIPDAGSFQVFEGKKSQNLVWVFEPEWILTGSKTTFQRKPWTGLIFVWVSFITTLQLVGHYKASLF